MSMCNMNIRNFFRRRKVKLFKPSLAELEAESKRKEDYLIKYRRFCQSVDAGVIAGLFGEKAKKEREELVPKLLKSAKILLDQGMELEEVADLLGLFEAEITEGLKNED